MMPLVPLSITQLNALKTAVTSGDPTQLHTVYDYFSDHGYSYADWGHGVIDGTSTAGQYAVGFVHNSDLMGPTGQGITPDVMTALSTNLAGAYIDTLIAQAKDNGGSTNRDIKLDEVIDIHKKGYEAARIPIESWTLNKPLELMTEQLGTDAMNSFWNYMRDTGGEGPDAAGVNAVVGLYMSTVAQLKGSASHSFWSSHATSATH